MLVSDELSNWKEGRKDGRREERKERRKERKNIQNDLKNQFYLYISHLYHVHMNKKLC